MTNRSSCFQTNYSQAFLKLALKNTYSNLKPSIYLYLKPIRRGLHCYIIKFERFLDVFVPSRTEKTFINHLHQPSARQSSFFLLYTWTILAILLDVKCGQINVLCLPYVITGCRLKSLGCLFPTLKKVRTAFRTWHLFAGQQLGCAFIIKANETSKIKQKGFVLFQMSSAFVRHLVNGSTCTFEHA